MFNDFRKNTAFIVIAVVFIAIVAFIVWNTQRSGLWRENQSEDKSAEQAQKNEASEAKNTVSVELPGIEYEFVSPTGESDETKPFPPEFVSKTIPNLSRPISVSVSPATKAKMERLIAELHKNPSNATLWSALGLYRKETGDYDGARDAWGFAREIQPANAVTIENLGVLYGYYLKDGLKSEEFFRAAIALEPQNINLRFRLFELYREVFQDNAKARASIEDALKDNPTDEQLTALLGEITEENK